MLPSTAGNAVMDNKFTHVNKMVLINHVVNWITISCANYAALTLL